MRIAQVNNWCRGRGGIEVMVEHTMLLMKQQGMNVSLLSRNSQDIGTGLRGKAYAFFSGLYSVSAKKSMENFIKKERPQIVHIHNLYPLLSPSILYPCRQAGLPVVMTSHTYYHTCPTYFHLRNGQICELCMGGRDYWCVLKNCRMNILESSAYALRSIVARKMHTFKKKITLIIALTEFAKKRLVDDGFPENRVVVLPNAVTIPKKSVNYSAGEYIGFVGRISPEKGIDTLLAATRKTGLPVRIAGDFSEMPELLKSASNEVSFVGMLDRKQIASFYRQARFIVLPSKWFEVCPIVLLEAMSHGLPVITTKIGGLPEIVDDGISGLLFEPDNPKDLAIKIKYLWENHEICRKMGQSGREKAVREYNEDVYYQRLMNVYQEAIEITKQV